jgi:hypothetical protein
VGLGEMASPSIAPCFSIVIMAFAVAVCILAVVRDLQVRLLRSGVLTFGRTRPSQSKSKSEIEFVYASTRISSVFEPPCGSPLPPPVRALSRGVAAPVAAPAVFRPPCT